MKKSMFWAAVPLLLFLFKATHASDPLPLVTGEYPPYAGVQLPEKGISTILAKSIFKAAGFPEITIEWQPWQRGYAAAKAGRFAASFPYFWDEEREKDFIYSEPLHIYDRAYFATNGNLDALEGHWRGLRLCVPLGWTIEPFKEVVEEFEMEMLRPAALESCLRMLESKRADLIVDDELVIAHELKKTFGTTEGFSASSFKKQEEKSFIIISRKWPQAKELEKKINAALIELHASGEYDRIVKEYFEQGF